MTTDRNTGGPAQPERMKAYHSKWSHDDLMKARGTGIVIDDGEAWRYEYTHKDALGVYDLWYRHPNPLEPKAEKTLRDEFAMAALAGLLSGGTQWDSAAKAAEAAYTAADAMLEARDQ